MDRRKAIDSNEPLGPVKFQPSMKEVVGDMNLVQASLV